MKRKKDSFFRQYRKQCRKCEYRTRQTYHQQYQEKHKERLKQYRQAYRKRTYIPHPRQKKVEPIKPKPKPFEHPLSFVIYLSI